MARKPLYIKQGDIELRANTTWEMKKLAEIVKDKDIPKKHEVKLGGCSSSGYGDEGEKNAWMWVLGGSAVLGLGVLGRLLYQKYIKKNKPLQVLPAPAPAPVVDVPYEVVAETQEQQKEEVADKPVRMDWTEWFPQEFGPMPELPSILEYVVSRSPKGYEAPMVFHLLCAFAALCFSKVRARYLDGKTHAPNLMVIIEGNFSAGKDKFSTALHALFKRIIERDRVKCSSYGEGTILQYVGVGATDSWIVDALAYNNGVHMFMFSNEVLGVINSMRKNNGLTFYHLRQAFDNGYISRYNKSGSPQGQFPVFLAISATGTPGDTNKLMAKEVEGGSTSRFIFTKIPNVGRYLESLVLPEDKELEEKRDQIDEWNKTYCYHHDDSSDRDVPAEEFPIDLDYVNDPIRSWINNDQWTRANGNDNDPRVGARGRMGAIAFHCAMVIHMLFGCPSPDMLQTRRKVLDLTIYLANYCMERFLHKFGGIQRVQRELNNQAERVEINSAESQATQQSSSEPDEENYSGGLSKSTVRKMYEMYKPGIVGYGTVAKRFNLHGENGLQKVKRAIQKYKRELEQKQRQ